MLFVSMNADVTCSFFMDERVLPQESAEPPMCWLKQLGACNTGVCECFSRLLSIDLLHSLVYLVNSIFCCLILTVQQKQEGPGPDD